MRRVEYGEHPVQFGMVSRPSGPPVGVAVLVHGGFWKPDYGIEYALPLVPSLLDAGWATWVVEYRRGHGADATLSDVLASIDATPVDAPVRVAIGHSAGGHLAAWAAARGGFTGVVSQAGVLDLRAAHRDGLGEGAVERFLGHPPGPEDDHLDPIRQVPLGAPIWCVHGAADRNVPVSQSRSYVEAAQAAGGTAELLEVEGDHFTVVAPDSDAWARTLDLLGEVVSRSDLEAGS
jgi:acetyl esterase/lipase